MKTFITLFLMVTYSLLDAQSFEMAARDTINLTDANGKKQGKWVMTCFNSQPCKCGNAYQALEQGMYKDNKRIGLWEEFHCNGKTKSKINYDGGRPHGAITFYYADGSIREEGTWSNNRWVGNYKSISDIGDLTEIVFDEKGKEITKKITPAKKSVTSKKK